MTYRPSEKEVSEADLFIISEWLKQIRTNPVRRKDRELAPPSQMPEEH